ncbi:hypothetical protein AL755_17905 [Arthrobacter sp. ERGS1:01]|uniref:AGE family epimerase/isomerase n=1 Tax=Arthrobacter sp. ERGS1:01 TaxID=1704044 RepID=UPI0006B51AA3|nr:AGE family epimerase/isomerase [Arthrobacter sp. ERGS1:01]ALE06895.1 hypothetical protein AL755_17905 [Arthrobacter sp. ERGS1:01]
MRQLSTSLSAARHKDVEALIGFARAAMLPDGFGFLDRFGVVEPARSPACFVTARMTFSFSIAALLDVPDARRFAEHGVARLSGEFHDDSWGGYFGSLDGTPQSGRKRAYDACFVVLAATAAATAGIPGAHELAERAGAVLESKYWSEDDNALIESWDREFTSAEAYWGANVNMHGLEAMLALHGYSEDAVWRDRALRIAENFINRRARSADWWLNEHFGADWMPLPDFNVDNPRDVFHPYGMTIGHLFEWSRLLLQLESTFDVPPAWLREAAQGLYETAVRQGWAVDGKDGFVYTVAWDGTPVIRDRPHWVLAEAISAAATWWRLTGDGRYANELHAWTSHAESHFVDADHGSWHHLLDSDNRPSYAMWSGKPDIYHVLQAFLLQDLPIAASTARAATAP